MENAERSGSDTRLKVSELAERYGEAQREITRLRSVVEERLAEAVILTEQRDQGTAALAYCEAQRDDLAQRLHLLEEQAATQADSHERSLRELKAELTAQKGVAEEQLAQLRAEVEAAQGRLRVEEDSAGNLDNYKKRAQLALKKVHSWFLFSFCPFFLLSSCQYLHAQRAKHNNTNEFSVNRQMQRTPLCRQRCSSCRQLWTRPRLALLRLRVQSRWRTRSL